MAALAPLAIFLGALTALAFIFASVWQPLFERISTFGTRFGEDIESAGLRISPERFVFVLVVIATAAWVALLLLTGTDPAIALLVLFACLVAAFFVGRFYLRQRRTQRIALFRDQLEGALRTLAGGVRVGLGIRQALVLTSEQSRDPAKSEFMRVVGLNDLGVSTLDAFDKLAERMTNMETAVLARVIRVQAQTGGDLASVLEGLAGTIRDRRRLMRRIRAVTAQGRATAWLLGLLPVAVGAFILTQADLRDAMLFTLIGQSFLGVALGLDALAIISLIRITRIDP
jgi:tight adherence protein B